MYSDKGFTKIKLNSLLDLSLVVKNTISDRLALSFGTQVALKEKGAKNKFGVQLDFNI